MSFVAELEKLLGVSLITDPDVTASYSKDQAPFAPSSPAKAVLLARSTEEISKAYMGQLEEIKKAYDVKFVELTSKIEKMETETIRKGGNVVVIPELLGNTGGSMSNADAIARMQAGR